MFKLTCIYYLFIRRCTKKKMAHKWKTWDPSLIWAHISCECICRAAIKHHPLYNNVECFAGKKGGYFEVCARTQVASSNVEKEPYSMALVWKAAKTPIRSSWSSFKWIFLGFFHLMAQRHETSPHKNRWKCQPKLRHGLLWLADDLWVD